MLFIGRLFSSSGISTEQGRCSFDKIFDNQVSGTKINFQKTHSQKKKGNGHTCLTSQHWEARDRRIPGAQWPGSPAYFKRPRPVRNALPRK